METRLSAQGRIGRIWQATMRVEVIPGSWW